MASGLPDACCAFTFYTADQGFVGEAGPASVLTAMPPAGAVFVLPRRILRAWTGAKPLGLALPRMGDPVTGYTDKARPPHRDLSLTRLAGRDLTDQVTAWTLDRAYDSDLPEQMRAVNSSAVASFYEGQAAWAAWSPSSECHKPPHPPMPRTPKGRNPVDRIPPL